jgi:hypothetical protein
MSYCQTAKLLGLSPSDWTNLGIGAVLGLFATIFFQCLISFYRALVLKRTYAGTWVRTAMSEYDLTPEDWKKRNSQVFGKKVVITVKSDKSICLRVDYAEGRGIVEAVIELHGDGMTSGEGPYSYTQPGDDCNGHAGWYSLHRVSKRQIYVYFKGKFPENTANGYEVWERE